MLSRNSRITLSCVAIAVIAGGLWFFWPVSSKKQPDPAPKTSSQKTAPHPSGQPVLPSKASIQAGTSVASIPDPQREAQSASIDSILRNQSLDNIGAARALGALVQDSSLGMDARAEALAHMLNLSVGNETALLLPLLQSPTLPDSLASTILSDALNSPLSWQADACLAVMARKTGKELHAQAGDHLAFLTGEDHGDDLNAWALAVHQAQAKWQATAAR